MSLHEKLSRLFHSEPAEEPTARRRLRYMRLERRFLLSADFGELCAVDAEDYDPFEDVDLWTAEENEVDEQVREELNERVGAEQSQEIEAAPVVIWMDVDAPLSNTDQSPAENEQLSNAPTEPSKDVNGVETTLAENSVELETLTDSQKSESVNPVTIGSTSLDDTLATRRSSTQGTFDASAEFQRIESQGAETFSSPDELADKDPIWSVLADEDAGKTDETGAEVRSHLPIQRTPSENDELNMAAVDWIGAFADDLSSVDETLAELADDAAQSPDVSGPVMQKSPVVGGTLVSASVMAHTVHQRARKQQSQLEDDHCAVNLDARVYPDNQ
ncbi:MAG: hypothetical protein AAFX06_17610 [Planctomycetota bacterium]